MGELETRTDDALDSLELRVEEQPELVLPTSGEVVDLTQPAQVARALAEVREFVSQLGGIRAYLEDILRLEARRQGTKTLHLVGLGSGRWKATVSGGEEVEWDFELLAEGLRGAGLPEDRINQLIVATVTYRVDGRVARQLRGANPAYGAALDAARTVLPGRFYVRVEPE